MSDMTCGNPPMWRGDINRAEPVPYERTAINQEKMEIERLNREIMKMQVYIQSLELDNLNETYLRREYPAVQDAWEQYQTVLRLAKNARNK